MRKNSWVGEYDFRLLLLMPLYWAGIMMQVYWLEDKALKALQAAA